MDVAKEIINIGLAKAADSLSFFTKERVMLKGLSLEIKPISEFAYPKQDDGNAFHVLFTEVKGDIEGTCFLNFREQDAENFWKIALPEAIMNNPEMKIEMGKAILMEADNIIAASVITQFANMLNVNMHGHIPNYHLVEYNDMNRFILDRSPSSSLYLQFSAEFASDSVDVFPDFLWMLDSSFMKNVQKFIEKDKTVMVQSK